ncbi:MAG TPA: hypothetical protein VLV86_23645 [Vicinamibacterales bacterium]|nr:hypothetical protein [Vicinamibacterales bacterium]
MQTRFVAFAAIVATALTCSQAAAASLTDNDVRGGWIADVSGQRLIYVLKIRDGRISGIFCSDCADPDQVAFLADGKVEGDAVAFRVLFVAGPGAPHAENVTGKLENGRLILTSTREGASHTRSIVTLTREPRRTRNGLAWPANQLAAARTAGGPSAGATAEPPLPPPPRPAAPAGGRGRGAYVPPGPNESLTAARVDGLWLTGPGANGQHITLHQVGREIRGVICGPCDNPFTVWPIDSGGITGDTLTFNIVHEDTAFPGTTFVAPFNTEVTATVSRTEMHARAFREDNGTTAEMTLLGPIRPGAKP